MATPSQTRDTVEILTQYLKTVEHGKDEIG